MNERWAMVKRIALVGWKKASWPTVVSWVAALALLALWTPGPFWLVFPSLFPILLLYFLMVGFVLEMLDRDWKDWHL
jgi:hypothetical protein